MSRFDSVSVEVQALLLAACEEDLSQEQLIELERALSDDGAARLLMDCFQLDADLRTIVRGQCALEKAFDSIGIVPASTTAWPLKPEAAFFTEADSRVFGLFGDAMHGATGYLPQGWPLAYLVATVVLGIGLLIGSRIYVSGPEQFARDLSPAIKDKTTRDSQMPFVGRVTGMVDCEWADPKTEVVSGAHVPLGRKYALTSGLMEITYDTGAKVILQGPCTYEVESKRSGYLSVGKLTARVEKKEERRTKNEELSGSRSSFLIPHSYFAVRTPTAVVTDLGTEFSVEVTPEGNHDVQVFVGAVKVQLPVEADGTSREIQLAANQAVRFGAVSSEIAYHTATPEQFVRRLERPAMPQAISVNFTHGDRSNLMPEELTGVVRAGWWNNVDGDPLPPPAVPPLRDSAGKVTSATLDWQWSYRAAALPYRTYYNNDPPPVHPFEKLLDGRFNGVVDLTHKEPVSLQINVSHIPYANYRVYVYYAMPPSDSEMHTFGLSVNGRKPLIVSRHPSQLNDFYRYKSDTWSGNYQIFDGLSGNLTIAATPDGPGPCHDLFIAGFQIVEMSQ